MYIYIYIYWITNQAKLKKDIGDTQVNVFDWRFIIPVQEHESIIANLWRTTTHQVTEYNSWAADASRQSALSISASQ